MTDPWIELYRPVSGEDDMYREPRINMMSKAAGWGQADVNRELSRVARVLKDSPHGPNADKLREYRDVLEAIKEGLCPMCGKRYKALTAHIQLRHEPQPPATITKLLPGASGWQGMKETGRA